MDREFGAADLCRIRDRLYECQLFAEGAALAKWQAEFRQRFAEIPDETILQIVDAHC